MFCLVVCGKVLFYELLCLVVFKFACVGSMPEVFHLIYLRKNGLSEVVGGAGEDSLSWTCSWTPRNLLSACWSQEGLPSPNSSLQTQHSAQWCLGSICSCLTRLGPCCWTQHKFIQRRKELSSCGRSEAVDFSLSEQMPGLQSSNHCPVFPVGSAEMSGPQPCFSWLFPQSN